MSGYKPVTWVSGTLQATRRGFPVKSCTVGASASTVRVDSGLGRAPLMPPHPKPYPLHPKPYPLPPKPYTLHREYRDKY